MCWKAERSRELEQKRRAVWNVSPWRAVSANDVRLRLLLCVIISFLPKDLDYIQRKMLQGERNKRSICGEGQLLVYFIVCNLSCGLTFLSLLCSSLLCNGFRPYHLQSTTKTDWFDSRRSKIAKMCDALKWGKTEAQECVRNICLNRNKNILVMSRRVVTNSILLQN